MGQPENTLQDHAPRRRSALAERLRRSRLPSIAGVTARRFGLDIRPFNPMLDPAVRLARICERQAVTVAVDVGANIGDWAARLRLGGYRGRLVSFEPQAAACATLTRRAAADPLWDVRRLALGREEGERELSVSRDSRWSSFLPFLIENGQAIVVDQERVPVARLDTAIADLVMSTDRVFLKLDVQGYELEVLAGASGLLRQVVAAQVEVYLANVYRDQPPRQELLWALESTGLRLAGVESGYIGPDNGEELYFDALFVRG